MIKLLLTAGGIAATVAGAGWGTHAYLTETFADRGSVQVAEAKADFVLDRQMGALISEIAFLERKRNPTPGELERLRFLRSQLDQMRRVRTGK